MINPALFSVMCRLWMLVFLSLMVSCTEEVDQKSLQEDYLKEKVEDYKSFQQRNCQKRITKEAIQQVDSFFLEVAREQSYDSVQRPVGFPRPTRPQLDVREDSLPLKPLIKKMEKDTFVQDSTVAG